MALWTFRDFTDESGDNVIAAWVGSIRSGKKQAKVAARWDAMLEHLRNIENSDWPTGWFTELTGYEGILEMKFTVQNIQWRPLGYFGPRRHEFTFLIGAMEKNNRFVPTDAPSTAANRRQIVELNPQRAIDHD
jgi:hypothetical protein